MGGCAKSRRTRWCSLGHARWRPCAAIRCTTSAGDRLCGLPGLKTTVTAGTRTAPRWSFLKKRGTVEVLVRLIGALRSRDAWSKVWWWRVGLYAGFCSAPCGAAVTIHLGRRLPAGSSGLPGSDQTGRPLPARPCSGWGLHSRPGHPGRWCALTAPFHPCLCRRLRRFVGHRRSALCCTFLRVAPTGRYPAPCPAESGRSSDGSSPYAVTQPARHHQPLNHARGRRHASVLSVNCRNRSGRTGDDISKPDTGLIYGDRDQGLDDDFDELKGAEPDRDVDRARRRRRRGRLTGRTCQRVRR